MSQKERVREMSKAIGAFCQRGTRCWKERKRRLARRHKLVLHGLIIAGILVSLVTEGGKLADWAFVALAVATEVV